MVVKAQPSPALLASLGCINPDFISQGPLYPWDIEAIQMILVWLKVCPIFPITVPNFIWI
jgi:hypothetical protein